MQTWPLVQIYIHFLNFMTPSKLIFLILKTFSKIFLEKKQQEPGNVLSYTISLLV